MTENGVCPYEDVSSVKHTLDELIKKVICQECSNAAKKLEGGGNSTNATDVLYYATTSQRHSAQTYFPKDSQCWDGVTSHEQIKGGILQLAAFADEDLDVKLTLSDGPIRSEYIPLSCPEFKSTGDDILNESDKSFLVFLDDMRSLTTKDKETLQSRQSLFSSLNTTHQSCTLANVGGCEKTHTIEMPSLHSLVVSPESETHNQPDSYVGSDIPNGTAKGQFFPAQLLENSLLLGTSHCSGNYVVPGPAISMAVTQEIDDNPTTKQSGNLSVSEHVNSQTSEGEVRRKENIADDHNDDQLIMTNRKRSHEDCDISIQSEHESIGVASSTVQNDLAVSVIETDLKMKKSTETNSTATLPLLGGKGFVCGEHEHQCRDQIVPCPSRLSDFPTVETFDKHMEDAASESDKLTQQPSNNYTFPVECDSRTDDDQTTEHQQKYPSFRVKFELVSENTHDVNSSCSAEADFVPTANNAQRQLEIPFSSVDVTHNKVQLSEIHERHGDEDEDAHSMEYPFVSKGDTPVESLAESCNVPASVLRNHDMKLPTASRSHVCDNTESDHVFDLNSISECKVDSDSAVLNEQLCEKQEPDKKAIKCGMKDTEIAETNMCTNKAAMSFAAVGAFAVDTPEVRVSTGTSGSLRSHDLVLHSPERIQPLFAVFDSSAVQRVPNIDKNCSDVENENETETSLLTAAVQTELMKEEACQSKCSFPFTDQLEAGSDQLVPNKNYLDPDNQICTVTMQEDPLIQVISTEDSFYGPANKETEARNLPSPTFKWKYRASCDGEDEGLIASIEDAETILGNIQPLMTGLCNRSLRVGLSRKQRVKRLHKL